MKNKDDKTFYERILICIALIMCAIVIGYNAFFVPQINIPTVVYTDANSNVETISDIENEEYSPNTSTNEVSNSTNETSLTKNSNGLININTATVDELSNGLSGIGETIAQRIVDYRTQNGNFKNIEDLKNVKGIGEKTYESLKDSICV